MNELERKSTVKRFVAQWLGRGYEKGESQSFWLSFLRDVSGISEQKKFIRFEVPVKLKHTSFIDGFLLDTKVIIEQKSLTENLTQEKTQSDGSTLTPYEQAHVYRMPVTIFLWHCPPFALVLGHIQYRVEELTIINLDVPSLFRQIFFYSLIVFLCNFHDFILLFISP